MMKSELSSKFIWGAPLARKMLDSVQKKVLVLRQAIGIVPKLAVVMVGEDMASRTYVNIKRKRALELGISCEIFEFTADSSNFTQVMALIERLNADKLVHGILLQLPLPSNWDVGKLLAQLDPAKDVDGLHYVNVGRMNLAMPCLQPCTPQGIVMLLEEELQTADFSGLNAVVLGRSQIVGRPLATLLLNHNASVTVLHSRTKPSDLRYYTQKADILIVAVGKPGLITADYVKEAAIVVDVGISKVAGEIRGDVRCDETMMRKVRSITPVPGGVGPMTIACLMNNIVKAAADQNNIDV